jgi:hypothetical protein
MLSDFNHIDNFFLKKTQEFIPAEERLDADWKNMKDLLKAPVLPIKWYQRLIPKAAAVLLFTVASIFFITWSLKTKKTIAPIVRITTPLPPKTNFPKQDLSQLTQSTPKNDNLGKYYAFDFVTTNKKIRVSKPHSLPLAVNNITPDSKPKNTERFVSARELFEQFYAGLEKPAQEFSINTRTDTTIVCEEGTRLFIPSNSFQTITGLAITGIVTIRIREFYSFADIVSHKITTASGGKRLETGGMINISAVAGNQELKVKDGSSLELSMPTRSFDPSMQLFVGEKITPASATRPASFEGIDWIPAGQQQFFPKENKKIVTLLNLTDNPYEIVNYKNNTRTMAKFRMPFDSPLSVEEMKERLEKKFGRYYDKIKVKRNWGPLSKKKRKRDDEKVDVNVWYESKQVGDSISIPLAIACRMKLVSQQDSLYYETLWRKQYEEAILRKQAWDEYVQKREAYSFRISNLGWINCDRFVDYPKGRLTDFVLNPGKGFEGDTFNAILILENERSAMQGHWSDGKIRFPSLPLGHRVNLVCAGVKDGKMYTSVQQLTITREEVDELQFETDSPESFKEKLLPFGDVTRPN